MDNRLHILHLEDNLFDAELAHRAIAGWGIPAEWLTVTSKEDFDKALEKEAFDAIMSDNSLPGLDGLQALQIARRNRPEAPFIFLTGSGSESRVAASLASGASDYVLKDQLWRLQPALRHVIDQRERQRLETERAGLAVLVDVVQRLSLARTIEEVMAVVRRGARELTQCDGATFVLRDNGQCHYADEDAIQPLWKGLRFPMERCISGWAMLNRQPAVVPDIFQDPRIPVDAYEPTFVRSLVMVPIRTQSPIGAIGSYWARPHRAPDAEVALIQALADTTSVAIENVELLRDLEQRVQARTAELQQVNEELEAFSASVSHDLRAPLRAIDGFAKLMQEHSGDSLDDEGQRFLGVIQNSAARMGTIIEDLLSLARIGRAEAERRRIDLVPMARDVLHTLAAREPQRDVQVDLPPQLVVDADPGLLQLVLENLLSNAWKYSGKRAHAQIALQPFTSPDGEPGFVVRDNGAGFDMARAGQLFEPFRRLHHESDFAGVGVGLAIVRRIVQKHGGRVWAEARKNDGASFFVVLPEPAGVKHQPVDQLR
jgi:signal transduction histidine kinase